MTQGDEPEGRARERWDDVDGERRSYEPWLESYGPAPSPDFAARVAALNERPGYDLHPRCVIAPEAHVVAEHLRVGAHSTIAGGCVIRGEVVVGENCSLNAGAATIGRVTIGDVVRIAAYAVLVGENHVFADLDVPIAWQGLTSEGVVVEDDVWIGAHVTIVDGVTVGAHSVIAAGAVVTRDVPPWSVVAGVPARVLRDRRDDTTARQMTDGTEQSLDDTTARHVAGDTPPSPDDITTGRAANETAPSPDRTAEGRTAGDTRRSLARPPRQALARFDAAIARQWPDLLARCEVTVDGERTYADRPGAGWGPRPLNDAVEIAGAFGGVPDVASREELVARIQAQQDPVTGLFVDPGEGPAPVPLKPSDREWEMYGILSCGYALEVLGAAPLHPVHVIESCAPDQLETWLGRLDWGLLAWPSGSWIDAFGTGVMLNRRHHGSTRDHELLWGWLTTRNDRASGMWGRHLGAADGFDVGWLMAVNGYYRMTRGTYAQFDVALPHPEAAIDTVLAHCRRWDWFRTEERNACNVLDVVHPLWLLGQQSDHRRDEIRDGVGRVLDDAVAEWIDGEGVAWDVGGGVGPGLQGTEMWLSIVHLAADVVGESDGLSWKPRGVHRLEPVDHLGPG